jgi:hypothetical protein
MPNELKLTGFDELNAELAKFPTAMRDRSATILAGYAEQAKNAVQAAYPVVTGALRDGVQLIPRVGRGIAAVLTVRSGSPHAHFYEFGTVRERPHPTFIPITGRERRAATTAVVDLVVAEGLHVDGGRD